MGRKMSFASCLGLSSSGKLEGFSSGILTTYEYVAD
jgi:hypothetical protein